MCDDSKPALIIDNGSSTCKVGFAGEDKPHAFIPTIVGHPRHEGISSILVGMDKKPYYVGEEALAKRGILLLKNPIERGVIVNWDNMEKLWNHIFYDQLKIVPEEHPVLLTDSFGNLKANREKMTEIMFEKFHVPAMHISIQSILSLYASGRTSGIVLDSGDGVTYSVPIYDGTVLSHCVNRLDIGGSDINQYMIQLLTKRGFYFSTRADRDVARKIKEELGYVAQNYDHELETNSSTLEKSYNLPDGQTVITVGQKERFQCPEALFQPTLLEIENDGVHLMTYNCIMKCYIDIRKRLYENVVLSGGNSMFTGFPERLHKELTGVAATTANIKVIASPERNIGAWVGGSILTSMSTFEKGWITKKEYEESGSAFVHTKC